MFFVLRFLSFHGGAICLPNSSVYQNTVDPGFGRPMQLLMGETDRF